MKHSISFFDNFRFLMNAGMILRAVLSILLCTCLSADETKIVGRMPSEVVVNNRGTAVYTVPVELPEGIAGLRPELTFSYDSGASNGLLGMGFDIGGLSSISRVATTIEQDGFIDGVDFDVNDRFNMDGHRLVCVSGIYGEANSEYRTEIDSFARVTAYGTSGSGPDYFVAETKSGLIKTYGKSGNSAHIYNKSGDPANGAKVVWLLEKVEDSSGNEINYSYITHSSSERVYLSEISYGAAHHLMKATFIYEDREDHLPEFIGGNSYATTRRLKEARVYSGNSHLLTYECVYDESPHRPVSRLRELIYRDEPTQAIMRTTFDWLDESIFSNNGFMPKEDWLNYSGSDPLEVAVTEHYRPLGPGIEDSGERTLRRDMVDMNGDGFPDRVEYKNHLQSGSPGMWIHLNNGSGFDVPTLWYQSTRYEQNCIQWKHDANVGNIGGISSAYNHQKSMLFDMNGDGLPDKLDHMDYGAVDTPGIWVAINNGSGFDPKTNWLPSATIEEHSYLTQRRDRGSFRDLVDMNGDGLPDRVEYENHQQNDAPGFWVRLNTGAGFAPAERWYQGAVEEQNYVSWDFPSPDDHDMGTLFNTLRDMDGDRIPEKIDYIDPSTATSLGMWISRGTGSGFDPATDWLQVNITPVPIRTSALDHSAARSVNNLNSHTQADLIDMNGDGLPDRITMIHPVTEAPGSWVALNNGAGFDAFELWAQDINTNGSGYLNAYNGTQYTEDWGTRARMLDMNGDGLPDKVVDKHPQDHNNGIWVLINNGAGFEAPVDWLPASVVPSYYTNLRKVWGVGIARDLIDMNGDGLPDRVDIDNIYDHSAGCGFWVYINNGRGFEHPIDWKNNFTYGSAILSAYERVMVERGIFSQWWDDLDSTVYAKYLDINGDGFPDRVSGENMSHYGWGMWVGLSQMKPTKLVSITDNLGALTEIEYRPLTDPSVYTVGERDKSPPIISVLDTRLVVSSLSRDMGLYLPAQTHYTYAEARMHMDGRGFLGFRVFESHDSRTYLTTTEILRQDFPYTGMTESVAVYTSDGQMISRTLNSIELKGTNPYTVYENGQNVTYYHTVFPYIDSSTEWTADFDHLTDFSTFTEAQLIEHLETNAHLNLRKDYDYDAHGNLLSVLEDYGEGYTKETTHLYAYDNVAAWYLGRTSDTFLSYNAPNLTEQVRHSSFTYNADGLLYSETIEPGDSLSLTTTYTRDAQGRISSVAINPSGGISYTRESYSQLDATGRFYEIRMNALGHTVTDKYDSEWGWLLSHTDANGRVTDYEYDALGRHSRIDYPDGTWDIFAYEWDASRFVDATSPTPSAQANQSVYSLTSTTAGSASTKIWYDVDDREITTALESFDGQWAYTDHYVSLTGRDIYTSLPYYSGDALYWNRVALDELGRPFGELSPNGALSFISYEGRLITHADGEKTRHFRSNARGEKVSVSTYNNSGTEITLNYRYDSVGNLIETEDSEGNVVTMGYDIRGNKTSMSDPDMGDWTYVYNALGQMESQTDAENNVTTMAYDLLGRVTLETYTTPSSQVSTHEFFYDGEGEHDEIGALRYEKSSNGTCRAYYYDNLGRSFLTLQQIESRWFYQQTAYDAQSRPTRLTHYWRPPTLDDGQHDLHLAWYSYAQETVYNSRGYATEVRDDQGQVWWSSPEYNAAGQVTSYLAGNGLETTNTYDPLTNRIERIVVDNGGTVLLDHGYDFDLWGKLVERRDNGNALTESFSYDALQRLDTVTLNSTQTLDMDYDDLGNVIDRSDLPSGSYSYSPTNPHQVTSAGGRSFTYDANGAVETVSGAASGLIEWNAFHKPDLIEAEGDQSRFTYDSSKRRVSQDRLEWSALESDWETKSRKTYVGSLFEQEQVWDTAVPGSENWEIVSTRIYIRTPIGTIGSWTSDYSAETTERSYFHRDHIGSVIAGSGGDLSDLSTYAQITREFSYDAWGQARDATDWDGEENNPDRKGTDRGYTGHEMLDKLGLIHMNGRIYDPQLARFISADPFIQAPDNQQSYNRYSYVLNNPLSLTDPSGFLADETSRSGGYGGALKSSSAPSKVVGTIQSSLLSSDSDRERQAGDTNSASGADEIGTDFETDEMQYNRQDAAEQAQARATQENGDEDSGSTGDGDLQAEDSAASNPNFASGTEVYEWDYENNRWVPDGEGEPYQLRDFVVTASYSSVYNAWYEEHGQAWLNHYHYHKQQARMMSRPVGQGAFRAAGSDNASSAIAVGVLTAAPFVGAYGAIALTSGVSTLAALGTTTGSVNAAAYASANAASYNFAVSGLSNMALATNLTATNLAAGAMTAYGTYSTTTAAFGSVVGFVTPLDGGNLSVSSNPLTAPFEAGSLVGSAVGQTVEILSNR